MFPGLSETCVADHFSVGSYRTTAMLQAGRGAGRSGAGAAAAHSTCGRTHINAPAFPPHSAPERKRKRKKKFQVSTKSARQYLIFIFSSPGVGQERYMDLCGGKRGERSGALAVCSVRRRRCCCRKQLMKTRRSAGSEEEEQRRGEVTCWDPHQGLPPGPKRELSGV